MKEGKFRVRNRAQKQSTISSEPSRKARTKTKRPKFLSLRLALSNATSQMMSSRKKKISSQNHDPHTNDQLIENMASIFAEDSGGPNNINDLLNEAVSSTTSTSSGGLRYADEAKGCANNLLERMAMRKRDRDTSEEKWVSMTEVVGAAGEDEVTSSGVAAGEGGRLSLKLDYQQVLDEWSGKGPLYLATETPQTVPDLNFPHSGNQFGIENEGYWRVPDCFNDYGSNNLDIVDTIEGEAWKLGLREASVLRYKEKRQSRLFSKRIRYEVRKLNAEKRPRLKGRFVKRSVDS